MQRLREQDLFAGQRAPLLIEPASGERDLAELIRLNADRLEAALLERGALLFRGFNTEQISGFESALSALSSERMEYRYGSTPRTHIGNKIFTATEYPPTQEIPLHNENAYQRQWPRKIAFCCLRPAAQGGATPIADMRKVMAALAPGLLERFRTRQVRYVRHYHPYIDVPWQKVFATDDREELARFCAEHGIEHEWLAGDVLRTTQICQGTSTHPQTGEEIFFNQAHLFHVSSLDPDIAQSLVETFGSDRVPRHSYFGDGSSIPAEDLDEVRQAFAHAAMAFDWQAGDVMLLDNMQVAHGRRPFRGRREVLAALLDPHGAADGRS